jgi:serine protease inhibitor
VRASLIGLKEQYTKLAKGRRKWVELQLPKFQVAIEQELSPVLKSIGITEPFAEESADFVGITAQNLSADPEYAHFNASQRNARQRMTHHIL